MEHLTFDKAKLIDSFIDKNNGKTFETYLFKVKGNYYIVYRKQSIFKSTTTLIVKTNKNLESKKSIERFLSKHIDDFNTKYSSFTKGSITFNNKDGEVYKFNIFGGFFNLIKSGYFEF